MHYDLFYQEHGLSLMGHGLWLRGKELNRLPLEELSQRPCRVLLARLSSYFDTAESFGHLLLYQIARSVPGIFPDLAFLPMKQDAELFDKHQIPWLLGTATHEGPSFFNLVGLSLSLEQELMNLPTMLRRSFIPLSQEERMRREDVPLLLLGGASAPYASSLFGRDPMVDALFLGDDPEALRQLFLCLKRAQQVGQSKAQLLKEISAIEGILLPDAPRAIRKVIDLGPRPEDLLEAPLPLLADRLGKAPLRISDGCPSFCAFCAEGYDRRPYRERPLALLLENVAALKANHGLEQVELFSFNFNDHRELHPLLAALSSRFVRISFKSQRFDLIASDPTLLPILHLLEKTNLTCGLEGISPRIRRYLHKGLHEDALLASLQAIFRSKARELKVFLLATGLEEAEDFFAFGALLEAMRKMRMHADTGTRVVFSLTPLVRFPHTPLEFADAPSIATLKRIRGEISAQVHRYGFEMREAAEPAEYLMSQVLARASDPEIMDAVVEALEETGFVYYRLVTAEFLAAFENALSRRGKTLEALLRGHGESDFKRWQLIETGTSREFLWQQYQRALAFTELPDCYTRPSRPGKCHHCGACPTPEHVAKLSGPHAFSHGRLEALKAVRKELREARQSVDFLVDVGSPALGFPREAVGVALARALMRTDRTLEPHYLGYSGAGLDEGERGVWVTGRDRVSLFFRQGQVPRLREVMASPAFQAQVTLELGEWGRFLGETTPTFAARRYRFQAPFAFQPEGWFKGLGLKVTRQRNPAGGFDYLLSRDSLKKGILRSLRTEASADGRAQTIGLEAGPRFEIVRFMREAFALPDDGAWRRIVATAID